MEQVTSIGTTVQAGAAPLHAAERVLERLARIQRLSRTDADPAELLGELRLLVDEAHAWSNREGGEAGEAATEGLRQALARDLVEV